MTRARLATDNGPEHLNARQAAVRAMWVRRRAEGLEPPEGAYPQLKNERRKLLRSEGPRFVEQPATLTDTPNAPIRPRGRARVRKEEYQLPSGLANALKAAEAHHLASLPGEAQLVARDLIGSIRAALLRSANQGQPQ